MLPEVFQFVDGDARDTDVIQKRIDRDDADYLVAELDRRVVGFVNVQRNSRPQYPLFRPHEFAFIENAVVDEPHRRKGVGTLLFRAAIDWAIARAHGCMRRGSVSLWAPFRRFGD